MCVFVGTPGLGLWMVVLGICVCWELNLEPPQEPQVLIVAELSLQPHPSYFLRQGLSLNLEPVKHRGFSVYVYPVLGLQVCATMSGPCLGVGDLNLGPCTGVESSFHSEPSPQFCYKMFSSALVICLLEANTLLTPQSHPNRKCLDNAKCHCGGKINCN